MDQRIDALGEKIDALTERLIPRISVFAPPTPLIEPFSDGSFSKYVQIVVKPATDAPLMGCEARLTDVISIDSHEALLEEQAHCQWSKAPASGHAINIPVGGIQRANIFSVNDKKPDAIIEETLQKRVTLATLIQKRRDYRINVVVTAKDSVPHYAQFFFHWNGIDDITFVQEV